MLAQLGITAGSKTDVWNFHPQRGAPWFLHVPVLGINVLSHFEDEETKAMLLKPCTFFRVTCMCGESLQECIEMRIQFTQNLQPEGADAPESTSIPHPQAGPPAPAPVL